MLITTTDTLQGVEIAEYIGLVTVATAADGPSMKEMIKCKNGDFSVVGENVNAALTADLTRAGEKVGADAIIGVRFQNVGFGMKTNYTYSIGTAVKLKK